MTSAQQSPFASIVLVAAVGAAVGVGVFGYSVPQIHSFYGMPWLATELGAPHLTGQSISQACACWFSRL